MQRLQDTVRGRLRSLIDQPTGLDDIEIDNLATSLKLQSWELVKIPQYLRTYGRSAIKLCLAFFCIVAFVPWTQTITTTGQLSAYTPAERPQVSATRRASQPR